MEYKEPLTPQSNLNLYIKKKYLTDLDWGNTRTKGHKNGRQF